MTKYEIVFSFILEEEQKHMLDKIISNTILAVPEEVWAGQFLCREIMVRGEENDQ